MRTDDGQDPFIEPTQPQRRPGAELARAREAAGIGLRAMADTLHLPEKQVTALENDDYANLPPPTFVRGYLRSYARALGLDADDIVGLYDALEDGSEDPGLRLSSDRHDDKAHNRGLALAIGVLALAVALSLGAWWWQTRMAGESGAAESEAPASQDDAASANPEASTSDDTAASAGPDDDAGGGQGEAGASADAGTTGSLDGGGSDPPPDDGGNGAMRVADMDDGAARSEGGPAPVTNEANSQTTQAERESESETQALATTDDTEQNTAGETTATDDSGESRSLADDATDTADTADTAEVVSNANSNTAGSGGSTDTETVTTPTAADDGGYEPPPQTSSAEVAVAPEAEEGPEQLQINVDGRSWIEIYDARGRELVYTLYTGSAPLRLRGWPPFDVFLGNSPDVSLRFNGNAVEKADFTRSDNTARFLVDASGANSR